jgi:hypothetical protein
MRVYKEEALLTSQAGFVRMSKAPNFNMVSELVEFKGHLPIHAPSPKSAGREGGVLGKTQVPHRIDETLDESL